MTQLKPYDGPILPLDTPTGQMGFQPYQGEILPLDEPVAPAAPAVDSSQRGYQQREFGPQGQVPKANQPIYKKNEGWIDTVTSVLGNPLGTAVDKVNETFGTEIPSPTKLNVGKAVVGGLINAPKEIATTIAAGGEWLDENLVDPENTGTKIIPRGTAAWLDQNMPEYHPQGTGEAIAAEVTQAAVGGGVVGAPIKTAARNLPTFFKWAATALGAEGGSSVAVDQDASGIFTGEDALIGENWGPMAIDPNGKYSDNLLKKRLNMFTEAYLISKTGEKAAKGLVGAGKFINDVILNPGKTFFQRGSKEEAVVREMADTVIGFRADLTNEQQHELRKQLANQIDEFSKLQAGGVSDMPTPTGQKLPDVNIKRDTMTAYTKSLGPSDPRTVAGKEKMMMKAKADMMRGGQRGKAAADLEIAMGQAATGFEDLTKQTDTAFGGARGRELGKEAIVEEGHQVVDATRDSVVRMEDRVTDAKKGAESLIENDPTFSQIPREGSVDLDLNKATRAKGNEVVDDIVSEGRYRTKQEELLYEAIPEDAHVNTGALNENIEKATKSLDPELVKGLGEASDNFKSLNKFANFELQSAIEKGVQAGEWTKVSQLRALKKHINEEQLDYLVASGDSQTADAAKVARDYYKNEVAPYFRQGPGRDILKTARDKEFKKPDEFRTETRQTLKGSLENPDAAEHTERVYELLSQKGNEGKLVDYAIGDVASEAQRIINSPKGKLDNEDIIRLSAKLEKFGPLLTKSGQGKRVEDFLNKLKNKDRSIKELEVDLQDAQKMFKEAERQVYGDQLKEFFEASGTGYVGKKTDGYEIFSDIFNNSPDKIEGVMKALDKSNDPLSKAAMKSAYGKWVGDKMFEAGTEPGGIPKLNIQQMKKESGKVLDIGNRLFGADSPIMTAQKVLMEEADYVAKSQTQRALSLHDLRGSEHEFRDAAATVITFAFGTLDRLGARVRAASGRAITNLSKGQQAREIMSQMYADPDKFTSILRRVAEKDRNKLSKEMKNELYSMFSKGLTFADYDLNETDKKGNEKMTDLNRTSKRDAMNIRAGR